MKLKHLATAALPVILMCSLTGCGTTKININDYLTTDIQGYSGYGEANWKIDLEHLIKDNREAFGLVENYSVMDYQWLAEDLSDALTPSLNYDKSEDLSNGDTIKLTLDTAGIKELENEYDVKLVMEDVDVTVSDLDEIVEVNPFDKIKLTYFGNEPDAHVGIDSSELQAMNNFPYSVLSNFTVTPEDDLSNGDTIKVEISLSESDVNLLLERGYRLTETEKEYTVEGVDAYLSSIDELPADASKEMEQNGRDLLTEEIASYWDDPTTVDSINLVGNHLFTLKEDGSGYYRNQLTFVYEIKTTYDFSYYTYVQYPSIMILGDGTCSYDLTYYEKPYGFFSPWGATGTTFIHDGYGYVGYADLDSLLNDLLAQYAEDYDYQSTIS